MVAKLGILYVALIAGSFALPTPDDDVTKYFEHVDVGARIVGGTEAAQIDHAHMAAMVHGLMLSIYICGSSIITPRTVLTAAHCIDSVFNWGILSNTLVVIVGTNRWNLGGQSYTIGRNITHPHYIVRQIKNDVGLLITNENIVLSDTVRLTPLNFDYVTGGVTAKVAGWGRIGTGQALSPVLLELTINTINNDQCAEDIQRASVELNMAALPFEPHIELCTFHSPGYGMCNGDSGSPLMRVDTREQVGLVSWGFPCARGAPDMFARLSAFEDWIKSNVI